MPRKKLDLIPKVYFQLKDRIMNRRTFLASLAIVAVAPLPKVVPNTPKPYRVIDTRCAWKFKEPLCRYPLPIRSYGAGGRVV
jgi:hypothetical protein